MWWEVILFTSFTRFDSSLNFLSTRANIRSFSSWESFLIPWRSFISIIAFSSPLKSLISRSCTGFLQHCWSFIFFIYWVSFLSKGMSLMFKSRVCYMDFSISGEFSLGLSFMWSAWWRVSSCFSRSTLKESFLNKELKIFSRNYLFSIILSYFSARLAFLFLIFYIYLLTSETIISQLILGILRLGI